MKIKIPLILICSRLVLGFVIFVLAILKIAYFKQIISILIVIGLLTDIFDGIIARILNISTQKLRRLDSSIDQIFWICILIASYIICKDFFKDNYIKISILLFIEGVTYIISYAKFRKEVATHAIFSKLWAITIMLTLIQVTLKCDSVLLFNVCFYMGVVTRIEIICILLIIKEWTNDIPSFYHAILLRKGKTIKKSKFFNG